MKTSKPLLQRTAEEVMTRDVVTIPQTLSLREAAHVLRHERVGGVAVVDEQGRCVGVLSAFDFLRWAEGELPESAPTDRSRFCPYREKGHAASGWEGWICILEEGSCPYQASQPTVEGRHISVCTRPGISFADWQRFSQRLPGDSVQRYLTSDVVTVTPQTRLPELARTMLDAGIHRVFITDEVGRPVGIVSSTDLLAALAAEAASMVAGV